MRFENIEIKNFRQYFNKNYIDLSVSESENIILVGGKNGYGKTNFLLSIVWCLYGERISQIDDNFKKEIRKEKNYSSFMEQSLNWQAKVQGENDFSVSLCISNPQIPFDYKDFDYSQLTITRSFDINNFSENLSILDRNGNSIYEEDEDKINFINDFLIPIDAAKFVFFDAEKISEVANLSMKDEGSFINDAFNKVLGLDIYEQLVSDLSSYIQSLKKHSLSGSAEDQVNDIEITIESKKRSIEDIENMNASLNDQIKSNEYKVMEYNRTIDRSAPQVSLIDKDSLIKEKALLKEQFLKLEDEFNVLGEVIPLVILSGKLNEVKEHLSIQNEHEVAEINASVNIEKIEKFIEYLFDKPPQPEASTLSLKDKVFFYEKAKLLGDEFFGNIDSNNELSFEHDFTNSDKKLIDYSLSIIDSYSQKTMEDILSNLNNSENRISEIDSTLNRIDADQVDEYISELISKRERLEQEIKKTIQQTGINIESIKREEFELDRKIKQLDNLLKRIDVSNENQTKIDKAQNYIDALIDFINSQKQSKKARLESNILKELQKLMHKLNVSNNKFISEVLVNILPDGHGMKVFLYDDNDEELKKESLSQGEKQLYISSLIKAILKESLYPLPIFIDTPLGRLDDEHISNILEYYYPTLSDQVILLSTNNEITPARYHKIERFVAKSYLIEHDGRNSKFVEGYFKGVKNDQI